LYEMSSYSEITLEPPFPFVASFIIFVSQFHKYNISYFGGCCPVIIN
jgi:hypothetical protein